MKNMKKIVIVICLMLGLMMLGGCSKTHNAMKHLKTHFSEYETIDIIYGEGYKREWDKQKFAGYYLYIEAYTDKFDSTPTKKEVYVFLINGKWQCSLCMNFEYNKYETGKWVYQFCADTDNGGKLIYKKEIDK